jgi:putative component of toxin-antitoxin plasmid stabilization module
MRSVAYARLADGQEPTREYWEAHNIQERVAFEALFRRIGDHGMIRNDEKFRPNIGSVTCAQLRPVEKFPVAEFKIGIGPGYRVFAVLEGRTFVLSHGCRKPKPKQLPNEVDRAGRIYCEDRERRILIAQSRGGNDARN